MKNLSKKISYALYFVLATVILTSCAGNDEVGCYNSVKDEFPNAIEIKQPIGEKWIFIVKDKDSLIYFVKTMNVNDTEITQMELLFK